MTFRAALGLAVATALALSACTGDESDPQAAHESATTSSEPPALAPPTVTLPAEPTAVLDASSGDALSIQVSQLLFQRSPLAVLVAVGDNAAGAAAIAVELGAPLLVTPAAEAVSPTGSASLTTSPTPPPADTGAATVDELIRLEASTVIVDRR